MKFSDSFVRELRELQPSAYETLIQEFEGPLYRFFYYDHRDHHVAEEQTAETFAQLVRAIPRMQGGGEQLRAFVFSIARHVQLRRWRSPARSHLSLSPEHEHADPRPRPDSCIEDEESAERVKQLISELDQPMQNVLLLRFIEDFSLAEIALALDLPVGTVKSHIHRGKARLRIALGLEESRK